MTKTKRILIVDDDPQVCSVLEALFEATEYQIMEAGDGEEGLKKIKQTRPDIIILDGMMPKKSGFQLAYELKNHAEYESIPIIMLTGVDKVSGKSEKYWRERSRADLYIAKPFNYIELKDTVEKMLKEYDREHGDGLTRFHI